MQSLFSSWIPEITNTHLFIAAAVLAFVLLAELIGIVVLIAKLIRAKRRVKREAQEQEEHTTYQYAAAPIALAALPYVSYSMLTMLVIAVCAATVVLLIVILAIRAMGYDFVSRSAHKKAREQAEEHAVTEAYAELPEEEMDAAPVEDVDAVQEFSNEDAYVEPAAVAYAAEEDVSITEYVDEEETLATVLEEESDEAETPVEEPVEAEEQEEVPVEAPAEVEEIPVVSGEIIAPAPISEATPMTAQAAEQVVPNADARGPYKVVEKVVTETYKEIIKETPAPAPAETRSASSSADEVLEKLSNLLDYELEKRKAADVASVATFAAVDANEDAKTCAEEDLDEDDEIDEDEDDAEDVAEMTDEDDVDDEENDIAEDRFTGNERIIGFDEATGCYIVAHYRKSFEAKLIQSRHNIKKYYTELKNALLSYKGTKSRISWTADSFHNGRTQIAKINVKTRILEIYLAIDPATLEGTVYRGKDVGSKKKYAETPFQYKVRTPRKFKWAMELVQRVCEEHGLTPIDIEPVAYDEQYPFDSTENLVARKLIKEYIRQEKPATTFELAEDHVPSVPDEDASVIPANANFSFELDNEMLDSKPEEEPIPVTEEPVVEELVVEETPTAEPEPEVTPEPAPEPQPTSTYKETVKVTEMRYTERYYANGEPPVTTVYETTNELSAPDAELAQLPTAEEISEELREEVDSIAQAEEAEEAEEVIEEDVVADEETEDVEVIEETEETEDAEDAEEHFFDDVGFDANKFEGADPFEAYRGDTETEDAEEIVYEEVFEETDAEEDTVEEETVEEAAEYVADAMEDDTADNEAEAAIAWAEEPVTAEENVEYEEVVEYVTEDELEEGVEYEEVIVYEEVDESELADGENVEIVYEYVEVEEEEEEAPADISYRPATAAAAANPANALVDLATLEENFPSGATIDLDKLKEVGLVVPVAQTLNIYTSKDTITKSFTVEANKFTLQAIKAIDEAGGNSIMLT